MNITDIPKDPTLRWEWIKFQLRAKGSSLAIVARSLGLSAQAVKNAKRQPYPSVERAIAKVLGLKPIQLWPERWNVDGSPHRQRPNRAESVGPQLRKHNPGHDLGHRKTGTEA